jgi:hypothetical protein
VHRNDRYAVLRRYSGEVPVAEQARHVIDGCRTRPNDAIRDFGFGGVDRDRLADPIGTKLFDDGDDAIQLLFQGDGFGARPSALATDVNNVGTIGNYLPRMREGRLRTLVLAPVRETVGSHIENAHHVRRATQGHESAISQGNREVRVQSLPADASVVGQCFSTGEVEYSDITISLTSWLPYVGGVLRRRDQSGDVFTFLGFLNSRGKRLAIGDACRNRRRQHSTRTMRTPRSKMFCAVTAVVALAPWIPKAAKVLRSAWMPALPPESVPAMVRVNGFNSVPKATSARRWWPEVLRRPAARNARSPLRQQRTMRRGRSPGPPSVSTWSTPIRRA